jgi:hypothetical protein
MPALASAAMARAAAAPILLHLLLLLLADRGLGPAAAVRFDYASLTLGSLRLLSDSHLKNGTIRRDLPVPTSGAGRALYDEFFWNESIPITGPPPSLLSSGHMADDPYQRLNPARSTKYQSCRCYNTRNAIASFGIIILRSPVKPSLDTFGLECFEGIREGVNH